uniref:Uncharacterized protein n=1 Tax=Human herpesvirus 1 TaxID=10298 RepID=A0A2Z4GZY5_HHV1|nr:hypothetical protein [Human alphaherpesvirus 1]
MLVSRSNRVHVTFFSPSRWRIRRLKNRSGIQRALKILSQRWASSPARTPFIRSTARTSVCHGSRYTHAPVGRTLSLLCAATSESRTLRAGMTLAVPGPESLNACTHSPMPPLRARMALTLLVMARRVALFVVAWGFTR